MTASPADALGARHQRRIERRQGEGAILEDFDELPTELRTIYRTAWELPMRALIDMAADRGAFIDQSQSLNLFLAAPTIGKLSSMYLHAWKAGLKTTDAKNMAIFGTSAGGALTLEMVLRAKELGLPLPGAIAPGTPMSDVTKVGDTFYTNAMLDNVLVSPDGFCDAGAKVYANGHDMKDPLLSPVYGDMHGFPPAILTTGTRDAWVRIRSSWPISIRCGPRTAKWCSRPRSDRSRRRSGRSRPRALAPSKLKSMRM